MKTIKAYVLRAPIGNEITYDVFVDDHVEFDTPCAIQDGLYFVVKMGENTLGNFRFRSLDGIGSAIIVSSDTWVAPNYRRSIYSDHFRQIKTKLARELGAKLMIATADASNVPAYKNLLKSGYKITNTIINPETNHPIAFGIKEIW